jgi:NADH-ubiquinone/plastoquinone oxidoreductase chain 6
VLYVFVVAYVGGVEEVMGSERRSLRILGPLFAGALLVEIALAVVGTGLQAIDTTGPGIPAENDFGAPAAIGRLLLEDFLLAFEAASFLLLVAAVGAVVLSGRRKGLEDLPPDVAPHGAPGAPGPVEGRDGGPSVPGEDEPTRIPAGTAEGPGDPAVTGSPDHETQEEREPVG